ncbi:MAG: hypothetical protein JXR77_15945 [Lentisphaeria bacterium]|nr:hypothetical protein [Lentisphaeria bacterium]
MTEPPRIRRVQTARERRRFLDLPYRLHAADPAWVPPLRLGQARIFAGRTAFFGQAEMAMFLAERGGRAVGRIAAIHNRAHNAQHRDRTGFFGFFECAPDDDSAAIALAKAAESWLGERGLQSMRGPVNPSMNAECGLLVDGFQHPPLALMPHNPPAYARLLEAAGLEKCKDLYAYWIESARIGPGSPEHRRMRRIADRMRSTHPEVTIRNLDMRRYEEDVLRYLPVFEEARRNNWGYVPMSRAEILETVRDLRRIVAPEIVLFAEVAGEPAGVCLAIPDLNEVLRGTGGRLLPVLLRFLTGRMRRVRRMRIFGIAALDRYRSLGITGTLLLESVLRGSKWGCTCAEASWVLEDNLLSNRTIQKTLQPDHYKTYRLYEKPIPNTPSTDRDASAHGAAQDMLRRQSPHPE